MRRVDIRKCRKCGIALNEENQYHYDLKPCIYRIPDKAILQCYIPGNQDRHIQNKVGIFREENLKGILLLFHSLLHLQKHI